MLKFLQVLEPLTTLVTLLSFSWSCASVNEGILKFLCYLPNKGKLMFMNDGINFCILKKEVYSEAFKHFCTKFPVSLSLTLASSVAPFPLDPKLLFPQPTPVLPHTSTSLSYPTQAHILPLSITVTVPTCCYSISCIFPRKVYFISVYILPPRFFLCHSPSCSCPVWPFPFSPSSFLHGRRRQCQGDRFCILKLS